MLVPSQHAPVARRAVRYRPLGLRIGLALNCYAAAQQAVANADGAAPAASTSTSTLEAVQAKGVRSSVKGVIAIKQSNTEISDSIVAEEIGKLPDNSVAAALQRVTGVQVARAGGEVGRCWCAACQSSSLPWFAEATNLLGITASNYFGQRPDDFPREIASPERTCTLGFRFRL